MSFFSPRNILYTHTFLHPQCQFTVNLYDIEYFNVYLNTFWWLHNPVKTSIWGLVGPPSYISNFYKMQPHVLTNSRKFEDIARVLASADPSGDLLPLKGSKKPGWSSEVIELYLLPPQNCGTNCRCTWGRRLHCLILKLPLKHISFLWILTPLRVLI